MTVAADLMTRDILTVTPDMPVGEVAQVILEHRVTSLPVVDDDGKLVGIVSEGDLVRCGKAKREARRSWWLNLLTGSAAGQGDLHIQSERPVADVMSRDVLMASEDEGLGQLIELLSRRRIKRLPIVRAGRLVGIVSRVDILKHLAVSRSFREELRRDVV